MPENDRKKRGRGTGQYWRGNIPRVVSWKMEPTKAINKILWKSSPGKCNCMTLPTTSMFICLKIFKTSLRIKKHDSFSKCMHQFLTGVKHRKLKNPYVCVYCADIEARTRTAQLICFLFLNSMKVSHPRGAKNKDVMAQSVK